MDWGGATGISWVEVRDATPHPMAGTKDSAQRTEEPGPRCSSAQCRPVKCLAPLYAYLSGGPSTCSMGPEEDDSGPPSEKQEC